MVDANTKCKRCHKALIRATLQNGHSAVFDAESIPDGEYAIVWNDELIRAYFLGAYGPRQLMGHRQGHRRHKCGGRE